MDVYSRFILPRPIRNKSSAEVASALESVIMEHGPPTIIQCDNGKEFEGEVKSLVDTSGIKLIHGRPYHPQSQGKCERSNRTLKAKIRFSTRRRRGFNWAKSILNVANAINTTPKRVLGNLSPFKIYHGRAYGPNRLCTRDNRRKIFRQAVSDATQRHKCELLRGAKAPSVYEKEEVVLLRYPHIKSRVPSKRYVINAKVVDRNLSTNRYKVAYTRPDGHLETAWTGVDNITSVTQATEIGKQNEIGHRLKSKGDKKRKKAHRKRYYVPLTPDDRANAFDIYNDGSVCTIFNPPGDGNCQFEALSHQLSYKGIHRNSVTLRQQAVKHMEENPSRFQPFVTEDYDSYLSCMKNEGTYGDHVTLQALADVYNMQILVVSSQGPEHATFVGTDNYIPDIPLLALGHYPEDNGQHYVSVSITESALMKIVKNDEEFTEDSGDGQVDNNNDKEGDNSTDDDDNDDDVVDHKVDDDDDDDDDDDCDENDAHNNNSILNRLREQILMMRDPPEFLPKEIQRMIILQCVRSSPSSRYILQQVNHFFRNVVEEIPQPEIHISPHVMSPVPNPCSVARMIRLYGRGSSLIMEVKRIICHARWCHAWLFLREVDHDWFVVYNIKWRRQ
ncbi:MAG: hypothetical protein ABW168_01535 [Sedimenticola sp.]